MELTDLKGLGPSRKERLRAMGINSLRDLLLFFPIRYEDHMHTTPVSSAVNGEVMIQGVITEKPVIAYFHGISRVSAVIRDTSGFLRITWFNEPWMVKQIPLGQEILLFGRIQNKNGQRSLNNPRLVSVREWMPVYKAIRGFPAKSLQQLIREALTAVDEICPETLPGSFLQRYKLMPLSEALKQRHFPDAPEHLKEAVRRFDFENMLMYLMGVSVFRRQEQPGFPMEIQVEDTETFWLSMPVKPTEAQKRVLLEIAADMRKDHAMSRLVQGDVGCGKTFLAFGAVFLAWKYGYQSAMMAPTEILARQHYETAVSLLKPSGIHCAILTGSTKAAQRRKILEELKNGTCQAVFGTHALISAGVEYERLGLVITDEQHRFGVRQRSSLQLKGKQTTERMPHVLVMSATPIPRTLALILYGDLNLSLIDQLPPGRRPVKTRLVPENKREDMYLFMRKTIQMGQQAYVVCPLAEDSEVLEDVKSAQTLYEELSEGFLKGLRIGKTWGGQKAETKTEILSKFAAGELDVLVATTVIEVGVNVPNATVMVVENAERYGLSQLHQLRGRVGRGTEESWCFLLSGAAEKLQILCDTSDGFEVARKDLELRGPGDLLGTRQSGESTLPAAGAGDTRLLDTVQKCVQELERDPALKQERIQIEQLTRKYFSEKELNIALN